METIIKDLPIPKEATKMLEEVPAIQELIEPEPQGISSVSYTHLTLPTKRIV